ncbi:flavodoxin domain-containing protein [Candidatus Stoquefichus massiliensis]|uniref:flavodoxin domain-containing protein n=1 Tax=Candidatus Stoquefichus massiliensis TaxID=1470350 RepID=UPI0004840282|nr:flavodoxin domain-containing protein [Candidatus Stoquefichus massiliensis]
MRVIIYKTKHGATRKVGKILSHYLNDCLLMNINDIDYPTLQKAESIIVGTPVYYGKLDQDIISFIQNNQDLLIARHYCLYVVGILQSEFMTYVTNAFDFQILKNIKVIAGLGGALYYPDLAISEKMILQVMNKRSPVIRKQKNKDLFENFNDEEIKIFAQKIKHLT